MFLGGWGAEGPAYAFGGLALVGGALDDLGAFGTIGGIGGKGANVGGGVYTTGPWPVPRGGGW